MAVLFMDSVDHYTTTGQADQKWDSSSTITAVRAGQGRFGGAAIELDGSFESLSFLVSDLTTIVVGGAVRMDRVDDKMDQFSQLIVLQESGVTTNVSIGNNFGKARVTRGDGSGTELGETSDQVFFLNTWHYLEAKVVLHDTTGSVEVHVDGVQVLNITGEDTINGGAGVIDLAQYRAVSGVDTLWDDMYIDDTNLLGDTRCDLIMPDGDGNYTEFGTTVPSSPTTHWDKVEELTPDSDTSYNNGTAVNQRDTFTMESLSAITTQTIHAVQQFNYAKHDGSATNHRAKLRISATDYDGASQALASGYDYFREVWDQDPNAGPGAWTESVINGMESGYEEL